MIWRRLFIVCLSLTGLAYFCLLSFNRPRHQINIKTSYVLFERRLSADELISIGKPSNDQVDFIQRINIDMYIIKEVKLLLGPYDTVVDWRGIRSVARLLGIRGLYYVLIDDSLFKNLADIEQKALIGHELGHIFNPTNELDDQIKSDTFAARYTSGEAVINFLNMVYKDNRHPDKIKRVKNIEALFLLNHLN